MEENVNNNCNIDVNNNGLSKFVNMNINNDDELKNNNSCVVYNGGSSKVYIMQGVNNSSGGLSVAVKVISKPSKQAEREIKSFKRLSKQNENYKDYVVELLEVVQSTYSYKLYFENLKSDSWEPLNVFLKRLHSTTTTRASRTIIITRRQKMNVLINLAKGMSQSVLYLHQRGVTHRDLKLDHFYKRRKKNNNNNNNNKGNQIKIIDFGLATTDSKDKSHHLFCGTLPYTAPEVWMDDGYRNKCDVWSLGICFYFMFYGSFPFINPVSQSLTIWEIRNGDLHFETDSKPQDTSNNNTCNRREEQVKDLLKNMLERDVDKRFDMKQVLKHQCFRTVE